MGNVYKQKVTRPVPHSATITSRKSRNGIELVACWKDRTGKKQTALVVTAADGSQRVRTESATYYAKFRDGDDIVREVPTGCRDKQAAMLKLAQLQKQSERVRSGVIDSSDLQIAMNLKIGIVYHLADYNRTMETAGTTKAHIADVKRKIEILANDCGFVLLRDIKAEAVEKWLVERQKANMAPRTRNTYLQAINGFLNWAVDAGRLTTNPLSRVKRADEATDKRRDRRSLTETELNRLLFIARWRPLAEYGRETVSKVGKELPENSKIEKLGR